MSKTLKFNKAVFVAGVPVSAGEVVEVSNRDADYFLAGKKAEIAVIERAKKEATKDKK